MQDEYPVGEAASPPDLLLALEKRDLNPFINRRTRLTLPEHPPGDVLDQVDGITRSVTRLCQGNTKTAETISGALKARLYSSITGADYDIVTASRCRMHLLTGITHSIMTRISYYSRLRCIKKCSASHGTPIMHKKIYMNT